MCTAGGPAKAFKCQPRFDIASPTSKTLMSGRFEANATTEAGGDPSTYISGISVRMASAILRVVVTIDRQDSRYPLWQSINIFLSRAEKGHVTLIHVLHYSPSSCDKCTWSLRFMVRMDDAWTCKALPRSG